MIKGQWVDQYVELTKNKWTTISDYIWDHPELRYEEYESAKYLSDGLEKEGFTVTSGIANIDTAFVAEFGSGNPVIAFLGEYDALSNLSQKSGVAQQEPVVEQGNGHGCGHNLLGTGALAAAVTLKAYLEKNNVDGTVRFYGCPAEEGGSGKTFMAREGVFDDVDVALTWHPGPINAIWSFSSLANVQAYFKFTGKSAHAAAAPHLGRSALDAVELMNTGVNYLREHIIPEARIHYAVTNTGGFSPNVVQAEAEVLYLIRAPEIKQVDEIYERVIKIAEGAALMTETEMTMKFDKACSNYIPNRSLEKILYNKLLDSTIEQLTEEEIQFAKKLWESLTPHEKKSFLNSSKNFGDSIYENISKGRYLADFVSPYEPIERPMAGSTDVADVSWVVPTAQLSAATCALGTPGHSWQMTTQGKSKIGRAHV